MKRKGGPFVALVGRPTCPEMADFCSLIPDLGVKLSTIILAGPTVLSAVIGNEPYVSLHFLGADIYAK